MTEDANAVMDSTEGGSVASPNGNAMTGETLVPAGENVGANENVTPEVSPLDIILQNNEKLREHYATGGEARQKQLEGLKDLFKMANEEPDKFAESLLANDVLAERQREAEQKKEAEYNKQLSEAEAFFKQSFGADDYAKQVSDFFDQDNISSKFQKHLNEFAFSTLKDFVHTPLGAGLFMVLSNVLGQSIGNDAPKAPTASGGIASGAPSGGSSGYIDDDNFYRFPIEEQRRYFDDRISGRKSGRMDIKEIKEKQHKLLQEFLKN